MDFDLVCDQKMIPGLIVSLTAVASMFASLFVGTLSGNKIDYIITLIIYILFHILNFLEISFLSDKFGRKKVIMVAETLALVTTIGLAFVPNWWAFCVLWFAQG